jgi:hypothetical protein
MVFISAGAYLQINAGKRVMFYLKLTKKKPKCIGIVALNYTYSEQNKFLHLFFVNVKHALQNV